MFGPLKEYSKLASQIPGEDYDYHLAFPAFRKRVREDSVALLELMDTCCQLLPKRRQIRLAREEDAHSGGLHLPELQRTAVMEAVDSLLENVDSLLDEVKGRRIHAQEQLSVTFGSELTLFGGNESGKAVSQGSTLRLARVMRPQLTFETPVDNSAAPFVPTYFDARGVLHTGVANQHPFEAEVKKYSTPEDQLLPKPETPYESLDKCPLTFIDTIEMFQKMIVTLLSEKELAIDLEHHDFYSYQGFTCLMQVSTRTEDFIVDCLKLRGSMGRLAPVFLNPNILKVLHGAKEDIRWLQKDFGLYLINFFDTGVALQTLHMPYGLAFAVDHFCQVKLNKKYQTADWRVRPLSAEMVHYARQDTHYLLYIYDRLKALLLNSEGRASIGNLLVHVFNESKQMSLQLYEKPRLVPEETYRLAMGRSLGGLSRAQEQVARDVFNWRDEAARKGDDSPPAVLHLSSVLSIASKLPTTARELLRCCTPVSAVVRESVPHLLQIVLQAVVQDSDAKKGSSGLPAQMNRTAAMEASGDCEETSEAHREWTFYQSTRPHGIFRPMTGAMPSLSSAVGTSMPAAIPKTESAARLSDTLPSTWFVAMQRLSHVLSSRPSHQIALPGADMMSLIATKSTSGVVKAPVAASKEEQAGTLSSDEDETSTQPAIDPEEDNKRILPASPEAEQEKLQLPSEAVSIKQQYGTGTKIRRNGKVTKPKGK